MRTYKFRAWLKASKQMITKELTIDYNFARLKVDKDAILMQYTGLLDKNGKEIYEGDIILCDDKAGEVKYDEQQGAYIILWQPNNKKQKSGCDNLASTFPSPLKEVIGNIWENPELLSKEV